MGGIRRAMARAAIESIDEYLGVVSSRTEALDGLVAELTVGETYFFREPAQFGFIRDEVLPGLVQQRGPCHVLQVWSAGCASGEEPYSLAILLEGAGLLRRAHVIGTDISRPALARAAAASYSPWSLRGVEESLVRRYFRPCGVHHVLDGTVKESVTFRYLNLAQDPYPPVASGAGLDLILCRNVLIYLDRQTVARIAARLFDALAPGGWLVAGPSDPPLSELAPFETVVTRHGVFYRRGEAGRRIFAPVHSLRLEPTSPSAGGPLPTDPPSRATSSLGASGPRAASGPVSRGDLVSPGRDAEVEGEHGVAAASLRPTDPEAAELAVRACANHVSVQAAAKEAAKAIRCHALSPSLHFLHAVLLQELGRLDEAVEALRRALYLDRSLAIVHFVLGTVLARRGEIQAARREFRTAADLASARPPGELVPLGDGERAGRLAHAARTWMESLHEEHAS
ncbi:MAG: CheR family methyltransferase [Myxococcota bacterium]